MKSILVLRRRAKVIRFAAGFAAVVFTPVVLILCVILFLGLGPPDASVKDFLRGTWLAVYRFFVRLFSGHALRPFILRTVSTGTCSPNTVRENRDT
jgi:hypothetical protein